MAGRRREGKLVFVDSAVDVTTGTITLKARFENADHRLWPGQYVQVVHGAARGGERDLRRRRRRCRPARTAASSSCSAPDGAAHRRNVQLVRITGDRAVVKGELAAGEKVIVDGAQRVTEGTRAVERAAPPQRVSSN